MASRPGMTWRVWSFGGGGVSAGLDNSCFLKAAPNCIACIFSSNEQASSLLGQECAGSGMRWVGTGAGSGQSIAIPDLGQDHRSGIGLGQDNSRSGKKLKSPFTISVSFPRAIGKEEAWRSSAIRLACSLGAITPRTSQGPMEHHGSPLGGVGSVASGVGGVTAMRMPYACAAYDTW